PRQDHRRAGQHRGHAAQVHALHRFQQLVLGGEQQQRERDRAGADEREHRGETEAPRAVADRAGADEVAQEPAHRAPFPRLDGLHGTNLCRGPPGPPHSPVRLRPRRLTPWGEARFQAAAGGGRARPNLAFVPMKPSLFRSEAAELAATAALTASAASFVLLHLIMSDVVDPVSTPVSMYALTFPGVALFPLGALSLALACAILAGRGLGLQRQALIRWLLGTTAVMLVLASVFRSGTPESGLTFAAQVHRYTAGAAFV